MGAGASAMSIPVVADFKNKPQELKDLLQKTHEDNFRDNKKFDKILNIIDDFLLPFSQVSSMDTLAKRIYQRDELGKSYSEYKFFLELIFLFQHYYKKVIKVQDEDTGQIFKFKPEPNSGEPRYENLIRTVGEVVENKNLKVEIPNNFQFITWNYDILFENTILRDLIDLQGQDSYKLTHDCILNKNSNNNLYSGANILKLNGTAFGQDLAKSIFYMDIYFRKQYNFNLQNDFFEKMLSLYDEYKTNWDNIAKLSPDEAKKQYQSLNNISFAWENKNDDKLKEKLKDIAKNTDIVVLIGYSFPSVNRELDLAFFNNLKEKTKIYIQGRDFYDSERTQRLFKQCYIDNKQKLNTIPVESGDFFFVPAEYFEEKKLNLKINSSIFR